jgi:hypothetical protein
VCRFLPFEGIWDIENEIEIPFSSSLKVKLKLYGSKPYIKSGIQTPLRLRLFMVAAPHFADVISLHLGALIRCIGKSPHVWEI